MKSVFTITIVGIFIALSIGFFILQSQLPSFRFAVLETGNAIMMILSLSAFYLVNKQIGKSGSAFVRGVSGASFLKLMVCMVAILVYVAINRATIHKPSIFILMAIYLVYSATETVLLSKMARTIK